MSYFPTRILQKQKKNAPKNMSGFMFCLLVLVLVLEAKALEKKKKKNPNPVGLKSNGLKSREEKGAGWIGGLEEPASWKEQGREEELVI